MIIVNGEVDGEELSEESRVMMLTGYVVERVYVLAIGSRGKIGLMSKMDADEVTNEVVFICGFLSMSKDSRSDEESTPDFLGAMATAAAKGRLGNMMIRV